MITKGDVIYFDNDKEFYEFCIVPQLVSVDYTNPSGQVCQYCDFNFTNDYQEALNTNKKFVMRDKKSSIIKRNNTVSYRTISKRVNNLYPWYYEKIYNKKNKD